MRKIILAFGALAAIAAGLLVGGVLPADKLTTLVAPEMLERLVPLIDKLEAMLPSAQDAPAAPAKAERVETLAPAVSVVRVQPAEFTETVFVTGSLIAREDILVGPEIEGLRVLEVLVDEGSRVKKGQVLARLVHATLDAQLAQNDASLARTAAAIAQAKSTIAQAEARRDEAANALSRAKPLKQSGHLSESLFDQREAAARTAEAQLAAARGGLELAEAEKAQVEAQRRELEWKRGRTAVTAPADGVVSKRHARVGAFAVGAGEPMFRIIADGEIELDAEVTEERLAKVKPGQRAQIEVAGAGTVTGTVRLVSPEVDRATRLGRVRIFIGADPALRVGSFARATIETARSRGLAVPASAILYDGDGSAVVQRVSAGTIETRRVKTGLAADTRVEIVEGLAAGDLVVAKSGTFLREGDAVRPMPAEPAKLNEVRS